MRNRLRFAVAAVALALAACGTHEPGEDGDWGWASSGGCDNETALVRILGNTATWIEGGVPMQETADLEREVQTRGAGDPSPVWVIWRYSIDGESHLDRFSIGFWMGDPYLTFESKRVNGVDVDEAPYLRGRLMHC